MFSPTTSSFSPLHPLSAPAILRQHYNVQQEAPQRQLLAWRERMGTWLDLLPSRDQLERPFNAWDNCLAVGELSYADIYSDPVRGERSIARISTERYCNYFLFSVCIDGDSHTFEGGYATRSAPLRTKLMALDLDRPIRMQAHRHRFSALFVPRAMVESMLPDADALHGRGIDGTTPLARLLTSHAVTLNEQIARLDAEEAAAILRSTAQLFVAAFGKQAFLSGSARAAVRAVMFSQARRYINKHLDEPDLCAEKVLRALQLPRHTLYRLFEHEGGIAAYISDCRLRAAAYDIANYPQMALKDIAYGVGFNSASAFSRTFRRAYGITPQDFRARVTQDFLLRSVEFRDECRGVRPAPKARHPIFSQQVSDPTPAR